MTDIWDDCPLKERPNEKDYATTIPYELVCLEDDTKMWNWLEKLKRRYKPYDELLKADNLIAMDINKILEKGQTPILIDEEWFNKLKEKAEKYESTVGAIEALHQRVNEIENEYKTKIDDIKNWHHIQIGKAVDSTDIRELGKILTGDPE